MNTTTVPLTKYGAELLKEELHHLKTKERRIVIDAIAEARSHGSPGLHRWLRAMDESSTWPAVTDATACSLRLADAA